MTNEQPDTLIKLLGLDKLSDEKQAEIMERFGMLIIEGAITNLLVTLNETEAQEIQAYTENLQGDEDIVADLLAKYPAFEAILQQRISEMATEIKAVYQPADAD
jgi:hypothetical protein